MLTIHSTTQTQSASGVNRTDTAGQATKTGGSSLPPTQSSLSIDTLGLDAITLPAPQPTTLGLEAMVEAIGGKERDNAVKSGIQDIQANGARREAENQKLLEKIQENLEKMKSQSLLDKFLGVFKWIGVAISVAVTAVAVVGVSVGTAGAGSIAAVAVGAVLTGLLVGSTIASEVTDGKEGLSQWVSKAFQAMGVSKEIADGIGLGFEILTSVAAAACSGGAAIASSAGQVAATTLEKTLSVVSRVATAASAVTTVAQGAGQIASSVYGYQVSMNKADMKDIEAILERIRMAIDLDTEQLEKKMEQFNETLASINDVVETAVQGLTGVMTGGPAMA